MEDGDTGCLSDSFATSADTNTELDRALPPCSAGWSEHGPNVRRSAAELRAVTTFASPMMRNGAGEQADLFEHTPVALLLVDGELRIRRVNRCAAELLAACSLAHESTQGAPYLAQAQEPPATGDSDAQSCPQLACTQPCHDQAHCSALGLPLTALMTDACADALAERFRLATTEQVPLNGHVCALRRSGGEVRWVELALSACSLSAPAAWLFSLRPCTPPVQAVRREGDDSAGASECQALVQRLMSLATEPFALVTRSHMLSANAAFCRRAGIVLGAGDPLPLSTLFSAEDQVLLFDVQCYEVAEGDEPFWLEVELRGSQLRRMQARTLRVADGPQRLYLLSLSESDRFVANEQALSRLERWAVAGFSGGSVAPSPPRRPLHPAAGLGHVLVQAAAQHEELPKGRSLQVVGSQRERSTVNVNQVVMRAVGVGGMLGNCRVVCRMQPSPAIALDEGQLLLAIRCLLEHAIQPLSAGDVRSAASEVIVRCESNACGVQIWVEPQYTRKTLLPRHADSGALLLSQRAIHESGGWLQVDSQPAGGLRYGLLLPLSAGDDALSAEVAQARESQRVASSSLRVLVIDNDRKVAALLRRGMRQVCQLEAVEHGRDAIALLTLDGHFDVILCDVRMADEAGVQVFRWLSTYRPSLLPRLLLMSDGACEDGTPAGVPVVHKPLDPTALTQVVCSLAGSAACGVAAARQPEVAAS